MLECHPWVTVEAEPEELAQGHIMDAGLPGLVVACQELAHVPVSAVSEYTFRTDHVEPLGGNIQPHSGAFFSILEQGSHGVLAPEDPELVA